MKDVTSVFKTLLVLLSILISLYIGYEYNYYSLQKTGEEQAKQEFRDECNDLYANFTNTENLIQANLIQAVYNVDAEPLINLYNKKKNSPTDDLDSLKEYVAKCVKPNY